MLLSTPFVRLPYRFDPQRLRAEVEALPTDAWRRHSTGHRGNTAVGLVNRHGDHTDDAIGGVHAPTTWLEPDSYLAQTIASFGVPVGRTRLMRIEPGGEATPHFDVHAYWFDRVRIHVPILTTDDVVFQCGDAEVHMAAGESWVFDTFRRHNVVNPADSYRVHLVIDTVGSPAFWRSVEHGGPPVEVPWTTGVAPVILPERAPIPKVAAPGQLESYAQRLAPLLPDDARATTLRSAIDEFVAGWRTLWSIHGADGGFEDYLAERQRFAEQLDALDDVVIPYNHSSAKHVVSALLVETSVPPEHRARRSRTVATPPGRAAPAARGAGPERDDRFDRPVIIVSPPRAGSTLLFETLAQAPDAFTIGKESHMLIESLPSLRPENRGWDSNVLTADDATEPVVDRLRDLFFSDLRDRRGTPPPMNGRFIRLVEKTPKNALRIEFLDRVFPDARYIFLSRSARDEVSSMMDAWRSGGFATYPDLPGWEGLPWSLLLIPGWQDLIGKPLAEICARQWEYTTNRVLDDLDRVAPGRWTTVDYDRLVAEPNRELKRLCSFAGLRWDVRLDTPLPLSRHTLTPPDPEKWRHNETELAAVLPALEATERRAKKMADTPTSPPPGKRAARPSRDGRLGSVHTAGLTELLGKADATALLSTYQSGSVISMRVLDDRLNTHFTRMPRPMGIARSKRGTLAIGTSDEVWRYRNQPGAAKRIEPEGTYGSCYVLHDRHHTGNVAIHELAYDDDHELWIVATRFSCLATLDADNSFVPRWRPSFVSELRAEDRCHLNGLAMRDARPRYVTAFAESDAAQGWRDTKAFGGLMIDVESDEIIARGLCMPHSPRWHRDQLWVLESGKGSLSRVDPDTGEVELVATLPGFTRGLAFIDRYALVGLSKVRESVFDGLPLTQSNEPLHAGLWVIDTESGEIAAFMRFDGTVSEVFDVHVDRTPGHLHIVDLDAERHNDSFLVPVTP